MIFGLPILFSLIIVFYYKATQSRTASVSEDFLLYYLLLVIAVQFFAAIIISIFIQLDKKAGNYGNELRIGVPRRKILLSKIIFFSAVIFTVVLSALIVFVSLNLLFQIETVDFNIMGIFAFIHLLLMLPTLLIYVFLAYRFNFTGTLLVSVLIVLSSILMGTTGLGQNIWRYLPWVWPVRMLSSLLPIVLFATENIPTGVMEIVVQTSLSSIVVSSLLFLLLNVWYNQWEGKGSLEE